MEIVGRNLDERNFVRYHLVDLFRDIDHDSDWNKHRKHHDKCRKVSFENVSVDYREFHLVGFGYRV